MVGRVPGPRRRGWSERFDMLKIERDGVGVLGSTTNVKERLVPCSTSSLLSRFVACTHGAAKLFIIS